MNSGLRINDFSPAIKKNKEGWKQDSESFHKGLQIKALQLRMNYIKLIRKKKPIRRICSQRET